jgi:hypothetical protein
MEAANVAASPQKQSIVFDFPTDAPGREVRSTNSKEQYNVQ